MNIETLVDELLRREVEFELQMGKNDGGEPVRVYVFKDGFYKSGGCAFLWQPDKDGSIYLRSRYDRQVEIFSVQDVAFESYYWFDVSKGRFDAWSEPDQTWEKIYEEFGL